MSCRRPISRILLALPALAIALCQAAAQADTTKQSGKAGVGQGDTTVKQAGAAAAPAAPAAAAALDMRITFTPGFRVQFREAYDNLEGNNDFFISRTRLKGKGNVFNVADYGVQLKIDNVGRFASTPSAQVEDAWLEFPLKQALNLRLGLFDAGYSRNALTSDSKLLLMDRSLIKDALTAIGFADNTVGMLAHGRPGHGRVEYAAGVYDNLAFEASGTPSARQADAPMASGRFAVNLLDRASAPRGFGDYQSSYLGQGRRLTIGANSAYQPNAKAGDEFDVIAYGGDVFFNDGPFELEGEYDTFVQSKKVRPDVNNSGWYVQGGYLVHRNFELVSRYQRLDSEDNNGNFANSLRWTSVGFNCYLRGHGLKVQSEYTFKRERASAVRNDGLQLQLQVDY